MWNIFKKIGKGICYGLLLTTTGCFGTWRVAYKQRLVGEIKKRTKEGELEHKLREKNYNKKGIEAYADISKSIGLDAVINPPGTEYTESLTERLEKEKKSKPEIEKIVNEEAAKKTVEYNDFLKQLVDRSKEMLEVKLTNPATNEAYRILPYSFEDLLGLHQLLSVVSKEFRDNFKQSNSKVQDVDAFERGYFSQLGYKKDKSVSLVELQTEVAKKLYDFHVREGGKKFVIDKEGEYVIEKGHAKEVSPKNKYEQYLGGLVCALALNDMERFDKIYLMIGAEGLDHIRKKANISKVADWYKNTWIYYRAREKWQKNRTRARIYAVATVVTAVLGLTFGPYGTPKGASGGSGTGVSGGQGGLPGGN